MLNDEVKIKILSWRTGFTLWEKTEVWKGYGEVVRFGGASGSGELSRSCVAECSLCFLSREASHYFCSVISQTFAEFYFVTVWESLSFPFLDSTCCVFERCTFSSPWEVPTSRISLETVPLGPCLVTCMGLEAWTPWGNWDSFNLLPGAFLLC